MKDVSKFRIVKTSISISLEASERPGIGLSPVLLNLVRCPPKVGRSDFFDRFPFKEMVENLFGVGLVLSASSGMPSVETVELNIYVRWELRQTWDRAYLGTDNVTLAPFE